MGWPALDHFAIPDDDDALRCGPLFVSFSLSKPPPGANGSASRSWRPSPGGSPQVPEAGRLLISGLHWNENDYYVTDGRWGECAIVEGPKSRGLSFEQWRATTGFDAKSTLTKGSPSKLRVIVRPSSYEPGRAHIAILNPQALPAVNVDLSGVLTNGKRFRVVSVKDCFGAPLASGIYDGKTVRIPLNAVTPSPPVGMPNAKLPVTEPRFVALLVLPD